MSQNYSMWDVYNNSTTGARVNAAQITTITQKSDGNAVAAVAGGFDYVLLSNSFMGLWNPAVTGWLVFGNSQLIYFTNTAFTATFAAGSGEEVQVDDITDAGTVGKAVLKAADAATGRTALAAAASGANADITSITGSAAKLTTARAITLTGDVTGTVNFDGSAAASITAAIGTGVIVNADVSTTAAIAGTKIVTAAAITSTGTHISIPAGTTLDAALKILADYADPTA